MGLKPDHWIRKMALEQGMIEPFVDSQMRKGVISYGLSSYGYDIRVADEFKIFTANPCNTVVDPKQLDERSMTSFKGDVCIIPPNSFALAVTVEHFRIPRNVLAVTTGKSTYARCFRGDTRVALVDGTSPTLEEMATRAEKGEMFWGYSIGPYGRVIVTLLMAPRYVGRDALIKITLDNDEEIYCTPDHEFMMRDRRMTLANNLCPQDSLMPLYRQSFRGYEMVYQPLNGFLYPTHRLADEWNIRSGIYKDSPNTHRHHIDHDRQNNMPWNIMRMDASEHIRHHNKETYGEDFDPEEHGLAVSEALKRLAADPQWYANFSKSQQNKALRFWHEEMYADARAKLIELHYQYWIDETRDIQSAAMLRYYEDPAHLKAKSQESKMIWSRDDGTRGEMQREFMRNLVIKLGILRSEITEDVVRAALDQTGSIRGAAKLLNCDRAVFRRFPDAVKSYRGQRPDMHNEITEEIVRSALEQTGTIRGAAKLLGCTRSVFRRFPQVMEGFKASQKQRNHRVISVQELPGQHDVYCLTVPEAGNFGLEAGVFVSNCGVLTNVTPLEPGWAGYVTLEISNTTPLPAKIYANEGIAQVLFFEADEPCEVSYADKKGKYQDQVGIVLPKV